MIEQITLLRTLYEQLCPNGDGMVSLQVGGVGKLAQTGPGETRISIVYDGMFQYVTMTDDEWDNLDGLCSEIVQIISDQRQKGT